MAPQVRACSVSRLSQLQVLEGLRKTGGSHRVVYCRFCYQAAVLS